eukprot:7306962-Pyramimonas_sp.AAC.1
MTFVPCLAARWRASVRGAVGADVAARAPNHMVSLASWCAWGLPQLAHLTRLVHVMHVAQLARLTDLTRQAYLSQLPHMGRA